MLSLLKAGNHRPVEWIVYVGNVLVPLAAGLPILFQLSGHSFPEVSPLEACDWPLVAIAVMTGLVFVGQMVHFERSGTATVNAALSLLTIIYVGLLISF